MNKHRSSPNFLAKDRAASQDVLSPPNQNINLLNLSKLGRTYCGNCERPFGRHTTLPDTLLFNKPKKSEIYGTTMAVSLFRVCFPVNIPLHRTLGFVISFLVLEFNILYPTVFDNAFSRGRYRFVLLSSIRMSIPLNALCGISYDNKQ